MKIIIFIMKLKSKNILELMKEILIFFRYNYEKYFSDYNIFGKGNDGDNDGGGGDENDDNDDDNDDGDYNSNNNNNNNNNKKEFQKYY
jgi:hypothetical protein